MRILVAEDHPSLARSVANGLREEGFAVDLTFDGNEAFRNDGGGQTVTVCQDKAGTDESDKFVRELKAWVATRLAPVGGDNPAALDQALEHLARVAMTDEEPVLANA